MHGSHTELGGNENRGRLVRYWWRRVDLRAEAHVAFNKVSAALSGAVGGLHLWILENPGSDSSSDEASREQSGSGNVQRRRGLPTFILTYLVI